MTFQNALSELSDLTVTGIAHNYAIDSIPDSLHRAQLPALLVMPIETQDDRLFQEGGRAFQGIAFSDASKSIQYVTTHLLIVAPVQQGKGLRDHLPELVTHIDNYFAALGADVTLNNALEHPAQVRIEPGRYTIGNTEYIGCAFRHTWTILAG